MDPIIALDKNSCPKDIDIKKVYWLSQYTFYKNCESINLLLQAILHALVMALLN